MTSNSFSRRRGNWRRPAVCESKKKAVEEGEPTAASLTANLSWYWEALGDVSSFTGLVTLIPFIDTSWRGLFEDDQGHICYVQMDLVPPSSDALFIVNIDDFLFDPTMQSAQVTPPTLLNPYISSVADLTFFGITRGSANYVWIPASPS